MKKNFISISILILVSFFAFNVIAQEQIKSTFQGKYHMVNPEELLRMGEVGKDFYPTPPPIAPVRNIAEFEHMEGVLISYRTSFGIPLSTITEMAEDVIVTTIVETQAKKDYVIGQYVSAGVDTSNCNFMIEPINSYWTRDFSGWFIVDSSNNVGVINFPYNRPRPKDNDIPIAEAAFLGLDLFGMDLIHTGGNYMTDGLGISVSCDLVVDENPGLSVADIDQLVQDYLGVHTYHLMDDPLDLYIEHVDCWGKFLDVDKILITEVSLTDYRYNDFEAIANYFANSICSYGYNYEVFRVYSPNGQPYTNSLILNNKVLVPQVSGTGSNWNDSALAVYEKAMPGYEVIGFSYGSWQTTDALHCRTHGIADRGMLYIHHLPVYGLQPQQSSYEIFADIVSYCDSTIYSDSVMVLYSIDGSPWDTAAMILQGSKTYKGEIPGPPGGSEVAYYIHAADESGRSVNHPLIGAPDPHIFIVETASGFVEKTNEPNKLIIYPNPATNIINIMLILENNGNVSIDIYSSTGSLVKSIDKRSFTKGTHRQAIDIADLTTGIYIVVAKIENKAIYQKFLVVD
ncbi:MAG: agmatine deiminase family protein [Bacteroidales bacterium]|nr:agmatine deiminase family protein [Bacteroidales bacterium]